VWHGNLAIIILLGLIFGFFRITALAIRVLFAIIAIGIIIWLVTALF
jgi:hypothetical protein